MARSTRSYLSATLLLILPAASSQAQETLTIREAFGVSHPRQIVDFPLQGKLDPATTRLIGADGNEVAYQLIESGKRIAVETDLPAGAQRSWKRVAGKPAAQAQHGVKVSQSAAFYEITNGLTGVRIPLATATPTRAPAPVQGVLLRDGSWSGQGPNPLTLAGSQVKMAVRFLERGPLRTVVQVSYDFDRPALVADRELIPAGAGFYRSTIEVQAGQPSVLFEEDTNADLSYSLHLYAGLEPTQARYQGHHSSSVEAGYEIDEKGQRQRYRAIHERNQDSDAYFDLPYEQEHPSSYATVLKGPERLLRRMVVWDPWAHDTGWYVQFYNANAPATANLLGIYAGRASRVLGAGNSGVGPFTKPGEVGRRRFGLTVAANRRGAAGNFDPRVRFQWRLFTQGGSVIGLGRMSDASPPKMLTRLAADRLSRQSPFPASTAGSTEN